MTIDPSKEIKEDLSDHLKENSDNVICKDGFCFLPNTEKNESFNDQSINIFDPL
tara:strand:- start:1213 stop:1374 length:162 start_codon:yes stop_codon:yes gene_type:complete